MKNKATKILSMFLAMVMLVSGLEFTVFASNVTSIDSAESSASIEPTQELTNIEKEIISERTAYSKVYLLEDGSYCNIETAVPIHEKNHNDEWVEIESSAFSENIETVDDARTMIQTVAAEQIENITNSTTTRTLNNSEEIRPLAIRVIDGRYNFDDSINMWAWGAIVAKPTSFYNYLDHNKIILQAFVSANCICNDYHQSSEVGVYEKTEPWNDNTDFSNYYFEEVEPLLDARIIDTNGTYSWNITDIYTQWDKGIKPNNGFVLGTTSINCDILLSSICLLIVYRDIDETDIDSTYHTIDMNRAGTVFINDLTSTLKIQQNIITVPESVLPISLKRIYNLSEALKDENSTGFRWNYESSIELKDGLLLWKTFDGTAKRFIQSDPTVENNGYTKWEEIGNSTSNTNLWIETTELPKSSYDYSKFYIISNDIKYEFNSTGKLVTMQSVSDDLFVGMNYSGDTLTSIYYASENVTTSVQFMTLGSNKTRVHLATTNTNSNEGNYQIIVNIQDTYNSSDGTTTNRVTYNDGQYVEYIINSKHELIQATDENGSTVVFIYTTSSVDGSRLYLYEKISFDYNYETVQIFDSETYGREYWNSLYDEIEYIQYDKDFRVLLHYDFNGNYTFNSYNDDGTVSSFVVTNEIGTEKLICGDFESRASRSWGKSNISSISFPDYDNSSNTSFNTNVPFENGSKYASFNMDNLQTIYLNQRVSSLSVNKTYVFGAWVYIDSALPTGDINIEVTNSSSNESYTVHLDPTKTGCWQYALMACKFTDVSDVMFQINLVNQKGAVYIDNATLYEATCVNIDNS